MSNITQAGKKKRWQGNRLSFRQQLTQKEVVFLYLMTAHTRTHSAKLSKAGRLCNPCGHHTHATTAFQTALVLKASEDK